MVNMEFANASSLRLLKQLASLAKSTAPDDIADGEALLALYDQAFEVDAAGRRTRAASEARRTLANPQMVSTPMARSVAARRKKSLKYAALANKAFVNAMGALGLAIQAEIELAAHEEAEALSDNRKATPEIGTAEADLRSIDTWLRDMDIKPYELPRLPAQKRELIARLLHDARNDPNYDRPDNVWPLLFRAGVLSTPGVEPTPHERDLLAEAWDRNLFDHGTVLRGLEHRIGGNLDVTASFAASCELIAQRAVELGGVEAMLIFCAHGEKVSLEADVISAMLQTPAEERWRIEAAIQSIKLTGDTAFALRDNDIAKAVASLIAGIQEADNRGHDKAEWISLILYNFIEKSSLVTQYADEPHRFWALFALALRLSGLDKKYPYRDVAPKELLESIIDEVPLCHTSDFDRAWEVSSYVADADASGKILSAATTAPDPTAADVASSTAIDAVAFAELAPGPGVGEAINTGSAVVVWRNSNPVEPDVLSTAGVGNPDEQKPRLVTRRAHFRREDLE